LKTEVLLKTLQAMNAEFDIKHNYQLSDAISVYEDSHYIDKQKKSDIASFILNNICKEKIKIFDAGIGGGRLILLPIINEAQKRNIHLEIFGVDNSKEMINDLETNLSDLGFLLQNHNNWKRWSKNNICVKVLLDDLEKYTFPDEIKDEKFDIVLSILTLHHLKNWRIPLYILLNLLEENGLFVLFEWTDAIKIRDGNFLDEKGQEDYQRVLPEEVLMFWKNFYNERGKYHLWLPEICSSNYFQLKTTIEELDVYQKIEKRFNWKQQVCKQKYIEWIEKKAYSNFYRGLSISNQKSLIKLAKNQIESFSLMNWEEKLGCRITIYKKNINIPEIDKKILSSIKHTKAPIKLISRSEEVGLIDLATLLVQHDFLTENSIFFTLNKWNLIKETWEPEDKPMIFNRSLQIKFDKFLKHMILYYGIVEKYNISATQLIFQEFKQMPILVLRRDCPDMSSIKLEGYFGTYGNFQRINIHIKVQTNSISLSTLINDMDVSSINCKPIKEDIFHIDFKQESVSKLIEEVKENVDDIFNNKTINSIKNQIPSWFKNIILSKNADLTNFAKVLFLHTLIPDWDTVLYIPSQSPVPLPDKKKILGLGGLILFEKNNCAKFLNDYFEERLFPLEILLNIAYRAIGINEYSKKVRYETQKHGLRSAIAAIMSRNMSHNPGSHGLAHIIADVESKINKNDQLNTLEMLSLKHFLEYLKARMDFVAEITTYWREMSWLEQLIL